MNNQYSKRTRIFHIAKESNNSTSNISYTNNPEISVRSHENNISNPNLGCYSEAKSDLNVINFKFKSGVWDRDEIISLYTCFVLYKKFNIKWGGLNRFIAGRNKIQIFNKVKNLRLKLTTFLAYFMDNTEAELFMNLKFEVSVADEVFKSLRKLVLDLFHKYTETSLVLEQQKFRMLKENVICNERKQYNDRNLNSNLISNKIFNSKNNKNNNLIESKNNNKIKIINLKSNKTKINKITRKCLDDDYETESKGNLRDSKYPTGNFGFESSVKALKMMENENTKAKSNKALNETLNDYNFSKQNNNNFDLNSIANMNQKELRCKQVQAKSMFSSRKKKGIKSESNLTTHNNKSDFDVLNSFLKLNTESEKEIEHSSVSKKKRLNKIRNILKKGKTKINKINDNNNLKNIFFFKNKPKRFPREKIQKLSSFDKPLINVGIDNKHILNYNFSISEDDFQNALKSNCKITLAGEELLKDAAKQTMLEKQKMVENYMKQPEFREFSNKNNNLIMSVEDLNLLEKISELEYRNTKINFLNEFNEINEFPKESEDVIIDELILSRFLVEKISEIMDNN